RPAGGTPAIRHEPAPPAAGVCRGTGALGGRRRVRGLVSGGPPRSVAAAQSRRRARRPRVALPGGAETHPLAFAGAEPPHPAAHAPLPQTARRREGAEAFTPALRAKARSD